MLAKTMGIIVLAYGETEVEEALKILRGISETFKNTDWNPIPCANREFVVESPNANALEYVLSRKTRKSKGGQSYFRVNRWRGEEGLPIYRFPR